jgi:DNA-binding transcriptional MerR regulator
MADTPQDRDQPTGGGRPSMQIGRLAGRVGVNPKTIRYYEAIGLLPEPARSPGGYRLYADADVERLGFIRTAQRLGLALDDVREILAFHEQGQAPCGYVIDLLGRHADELDERIAEMQRLREQLTKLVARAHHLPDRAATYCPVIEHRLDRQR